MIGLEYCGDEKVLLNQVIIESGYAKILVNYCDRSEFSEMKWVQNNGCNE